jgi:hypothetical protein
MQRREYQVLDGDVPEENLEEGLDAEEEQRLLEESGGEPSTGDQPEDGTVPDDEPAPEEPVPEASAPPEPPQ